MIKTFFTVEIGYCRMNHIPGCCRTKNVENEFSSTNFLGLFSTNYTYECYNEYPLFFRFNKKARDYVIFHYIVSVVQTCSTGLSCHLILMLYVPVVYLTVGRQFVFIPFNRGNLKIGIHSRHSSDDYECRRRCRLTVLIRKLRPRYFRLITIKLYSHLRIC